MARSSAAFRSASDERLAKARLAFAQCHLGALVIRDVAEEHRDAARAADAKGIDVEPAVERRRIILETGRLPGERHAAVGVENQCRSWSGAMSRIHRPAPFSMPVYRSTDSLISRKR